MTMGDIRAVTIADADEKLFMCQHTLCWVSSCAISRSTEILNLHNIDPFLTHLYPLFKTTRPVIMGKLTTQDSSLTQLRGCHQSSGNNSSQCVARSLLQTSHRCHPQDMLCMLLFQAFWPALGLGIADHACTPNQSQSQCSLMKFISPSMSGQKDI